MVCTCPSVSCAAHSIMVPHYWLPELQSEISDIHPEFSYFFFQYPEHMDQTFNSLYHTTTIKSTHDNVKIYTHLYATLIHWGVGLSSTTQVAIGEKTNSLHTSLSHTRTQRWEGTLSCTTHSTLIKLSIHAIIFVWSASVRQLERAKATWASFLAHPPTKG